MTTTTTTKENRLKITIGLTRTDRQANYVPAMDGYRPGAKQDVIELEVEAPLAQPEGGWQAVEVGEAYFKATNAPQEVIEADPLALAVYRALAEKVREQGGVKHRLEMFVGDTVSLDGGPLVSCERFGWKEVSA